MRPTFIIASVSALFGVSRAFNAFLRLFLRQDSGEALLPALARNMLLTDVLLSALFWSLLGVGLAHGIAWLGRRFEWSGNLLPELARPFTTLLVPAGMTLVSVGSLLVSPAFPYGVNLVLTLTLEGPFPALLTAMLFLACLAHTISHALGPLGAPVIPLADPWRRRAIGALVVAVALGTFVVATPPRFHEEGIGQGNMFKYLRMASVFAGTGTLDISRAEENTSPRIFEFLSRGPEMLRRYTAAAGALGREVSSAMAEGRLYRGELRASKVNRSMFRSVEGGVYYINAPGPGLLLVPSYLIDTSWNRLFDTSGQRFQILFWQLLAALLVYEVFASARELSSEAASGLTAFAIATAVPFLLFTFQIYPELPGGLLLLHAFRKLVLDPAPSGLAILSGALALSGLPWLHQKYSVAAATLAVITAVRLLRRTPGGIHHHPYKLAFLAAPLAPSAFSIFLYNHALTGSLSPTATFRAVARSSFEPQSFLKGLLGLAFDLENGILVFAPLYVLALVGMSALILRHRRLATPYVLVLCSYLLVVASFPYWPGAVSTMGRYVLSILPLLALPLVLVVGRALRDGVLAGTAIVLAAASFAFTLSFLEDLIPSYQAVLLWRRTLYSDPMQYVPSMLTDGFLGSGPAHFAKLLTLVLIVALLVYRLRGRLREEPFSVHVEDSCFARNASLSAGGLMLGVCALGALLEHWPSNETAKRGPEYRETVGLPEGRVLSVVGEHGFEGPGVWVPGGGRTRFLLTSRTKVSQLTLLVTNGPRENSIVIQERGKKNLELSLPPEGPNRVDLLLRNPYRFEGPERRSYLYDFTVISKGSFVPVEEGRSDDTRSLGAYVRLR